MSLPVIWKGLLTPLRIAELRIADVADRQTEPVLSATGGGMSAAGLVRPEALSMRGRACPRAPAINGGTLHPAHSQAQMPIA